MSRSDFPPTRKATILPEAKELSLKINYFNKYVLKVDPFASAQSTVCLNDAYLRYNYGIYFSFKKNGYIYPYYILNITSAKEWSDV